MQIKKNFQKNMFQSTKKIIFLIQKLESVNYFFFRINCILYGIELLFKQNLCTFYKPNQNYLFNELEKLNDTNN